MPCDCQVLHLTPHQHPNTKLWSEVLPYIIHRLYDRKHNSLKFDHTVSHLRMIFLKSHSDNISAPLPTFHTKSFTFENITSSALERRYHPFPLMNVLFVLKNTQIVNLKLPISIVNMSATFLHLRYLNCRNFNCSFNNSTCFYLI